jgi:hypothetical protein
MRFSITVFRAPVGQLVRNLGRVVGDRARLPTPLPSEPTHASFDLEAVGLTHMRRAARRASQPDPFRVKQYSQSIRDKIECSEQSLSEKPSGSAFEQFDRGVMSF